MAGKPHETLANIPDALLGTSLKEYILEAVGKYRVEGFTLSQSRSIISFLDDLAVYIKERGIIQNDV